MSLDTRLPLFPITTTVSTGPEGPHLAINGVSLRNLAEEYGTPLYVYDQVTMDEAVAQYRRSLADHYPAQAEITFAGKSFLCVALVQWAERRRLWLDCTGRGELHIATSGGMARERTLVHGVNKTAADLDAAVRQAGVIVVDNLHELYRLGRLLEPLDAALRPDLWLRLRPGQAVDTHVYRQTGQENSKFGMGVNEARDAVRYCLDLALPLTGIHFHQGSHFHDPTPIGPALDHALNLISELRRELGWTPASLSPGGGWGVAYHEDELPHPCIDDYVRFLAQHLSKGCQARAIPLPRLHVEPGRSIAARAGIAIYRVGVEKRTASRRWLLTDGGMADNPRPALYGARYSALPVEAPGRADVEPAWIAGPYCESGDVLIEDLPLPALESGELLAVPVSGAYQLAMGSNYNGACKPAVLWIVDSGARMIQRRQEPVDLIARDLPLPAE